MQLMQEWMQRVKAYLPAQEKSSFSRQESLAWQAEAKLALDDLHAAENYYNNISDPDLVEYAVYELEAARRKYEYLLRRIRYQEFHAAE